MPLTPDALHDLTAAGLHPEVDAPLRKRAWWRVGGPADAWLALRDRAQLQAALRVAAAHGLPVRVLGNGSNVLVHDEGVRGLVIQLTGLDEAVALPDGALRLGAGLRNAVALARAAKHGWTGLHTLAGIPGTLGGAVRMNAGSALGEISDQLVDVELVHPDGSISALPASALGLGYRTCHLPPGAIVTAVTLRQTDEAPDAAQARIQAFLARRKATQPLDLPSCGSTFRNPPGDAAGRLIEAAGLKGLSIGGAQVSPVHANFIVNTGDATAADIHAVIEAVRAAVLAHHGVDLHPEVERLGGPWG